MILLINLNRERDASCGKALDRLLGTFLLNLLLSLCICAVFEEAGSFVIYYIREKTTTTE